MQWRTKGISDSSSTYQVHGLSAKERKKKRVRAPWEHLSTQYTSPKPVLVSAGAELIFSTAQAWGGCEENQLYPG